MELQTDSLPNNKNKIKAKADIWVIENEMSWLKAQTVLVKCAKCVKDIKQKGAMTSGKERVDIDERMLLAMAV